VTVENLPDEKILREYVGCFGLGLRTLYEQLPKGVGPLDPENPLIFTTGPLTGTDFPAPTNCTITTLNFNTGFTVGRAHSHGYFGSYMKFAGFDQLIIEGASLEPVYLWIHDEEVEIRNAVGIWGKDTHETEDSVKDDLKEARASVAAIGPAGENMCHAALVENDKNHTFAHGGCGAVMGSKKLKAIAIYGTGSVGVVNKEGLKPLREKWVADLFTPGLIRVGRAGIPKSDYKFYRESYMLATKNLTSAPLPNWGADMSKHKITLKPCFKCPIACSYDVEVVSGPHKGYTATLAGGGENLEGAAGMIGVSETGTIFYLTDLLDRLGFEAGDIGSTLGLAFECFEEGLITEEDTGGLLLKWGNAEAAERLLKKICQKEGWIGKILSQGPKRAAEAIGGDASERVVYVKGTGINIHDWRSRWGIMLGQILGGGTGWPAPAADLRAEPSVGYNKSTEPRKPEGKPLEIRKTGIIKFWNDSTGLCWFASWGVPNALSYTTKAVSLITGWDITEEEALEIGERIVNLERVFNIKHGLTPADDLDVGPRLLEPVPEGPAKGKTLKPYLKWMVSEYYKLMGWDLKTGKPYKSTLERLNLGELVKDIWN